MAVLAGPLTPSGSCADTRLLSPMSKGQDWAVAITMQEPPGCWHIHVS